MKNGCMKFAVCSYVHKDSFVNLWTLLTTEHMSTQDSKLGKLSQHTYSMEMTHP